VHLGPSSERDISIHEEMVACNVIASSFMLFCVSLRNLLHELMYVGGSEEVGVTDYYKTHCIIVFHFEDSSSVIPLYFGVLLIKQN